MKILFYMNSIRHGGAERVVTNLATFFSNEENDVVLVTSFVGDSEYTYGEKIKRYSLYEDAIKGGLSRNFLLISKLHKLIKKENPDIVVSFMGEPNFRACIATMFTGSKLLLSVRNDPNREYAGRKRKYLAQRLFKRADGIVFQTEDAQKWFPKEIQQKSRIIHNSVAENFYNTHYEGERKNIVSVGRLSQQKNHELLIDAFAKISDEINEDLYIYGDGILRGKLQNKIKQLGLENRVFLPGLIDDVANTIKSARLFVLSSDQEGMPNCLMEAMALGIPCVSTDCPCGGPRTLFGAEFGSYLVPIKNRDKLAEKILAVLNENAEIVGQAFGKRAEQFKPSIINCQWKDYLNEIVGSK